MNDKRATTNDVVANALAWCGKAVRNAFVEKTFSKGEKVRFWDGARFIPATVVIDDGEDVTITIDGKRMVVRKRSVSKNAG